jgi:hypothetical protein
MKDLIRFQPRRTIRSFDERRGYITHELFFELQSRWPQFFPKHPNLMHVEGSKDDPAVNEVIEFLRQHGREPYWKKYPSCPFDHPSLYQIEGIRVFEPSDFEQAEYLAFAPEAIITNDGSKDDEGRLRIKRGKINRQPIGRPSPWGVPVCKDHLKREMEAEHFIGLILERIHLVGERADDEAVWSMTSDREMPALLNRLVCQDGTDYEFSKALGCYVDDFHYPPLLRFPASAVHGMEPFDFAITRERPHHLRGPDFPGDPWKKYEPYVIVSRPFHHWCVKHKLKIEWWPVVLE